MRLCVCIPCFYKGVPVENAIRSVAALGYDAAELWGWKDMDLSAVSRALAETGVELLSMCTTEFRMTDPAFRQSWLAGLEESCRAAARLGVKRLITQVGPDTGAPRSLQREAIVETLRAAVPILEAYGVTVMLEPLNTLVDHKGYFLTTAQERVAIVRQVGHPLVKLVYDIYHQQITEGNILPTVTANLDCIAHLHAAGHPGRKELQLGESNYPVIFAAIERSGYTGACGLEYMPSMAPLESLRLTRELFG